MLGNQKLFKKLHKNANSVIHFESLTFLCEISDSRKLFPPTKTVDQYFTETYLKSCQTLSQKALLKCLTP